MNERRRSIRLVPLATAGAVVVSVAYPTIVLVGRAVSPPPQGGKLLLALAATACYLPLYVRHVVYGVRAVRPAGARWTLGAMAVVIVGALPITWVGWLLNLDALAVSVLLLVRRRWSLVIFAGLVAAPIPLAIALGAPKYGPYYAYGVALRSMTQFVVIWLLGAIRQLEAARLALAEEAVIRERLRIDGELQQTLGVALEAIADQAEQASALVGRSPATAAAELRALVDRSRRTLAEVSWLSVDGLVRAVGVGGGQGPGLR